MLLFDIVNQYFSPFVSRRFCLYFYLLSLIFGVTFFFFLFVGIFFIITNYKKIKLNSVIVFNWLLFIANTFVAYFVNRLLYSMCLNSMN